MIGEMTPRRSPGCPSDLELDELASGDLAKLPRGDHLRSHIDGCQRCGPRLAARQSDPILAPDLATLRPLLLSLDLVAGNRTRRRLLATAAGVMGSGALAGLLLWTGVISRRDELAGDRTKGSLVLTVHVKRASIDGTVPRIDDVNGEGQLGAGDEMRFSIVAAQSGFAVVLGLDSVPSVTTYVPAADAPHRPTPIEGSRSVILPGSVVADDTAGLERIVLIVCQTETEPETLRRKVEAAWKAAAGRPEPVSSWGTGCLETSVLLHKDKPKDRR